MATFDPSEFHVDADIRRAETLPARAFTDPAFLEHELSTVFRKSWLLVPERAGAEREQDPRPVAELVASRGSRLPFAMQGKSLFLQRGWDDDELRAFPNACTHAWYPLVSGPGRGNTLVCGQHGRKFDCAGKFVAQRGFSGDLPDFPRACDHLQSLPVERWRDFLFVALEKPNLGLRELLAEVDATLSRLPAEGMVSPSGVVESREVPGNWKQHAWNFMDVFHVPMIHRSPGGLADAIELPTYRTELHGQAALQWAYARKPEHGFDPEQLPERFRDASGKRVFALWWFIFPNLALNFYPWGLSVNVYQPIPGRPDATRFLWYQFVLDPAKFAERDRIWLNRQVDAEDIEAMAQVRQGLNSGFAPRGRFSPTEETGPHWFHRRVYEAAFAATS